MSESNIIPRSALSRRGFLSAAFVASAAVLLPSPTYAEAEDNDVIVSPTDTGFMVYSSHDGSAAEVIYTESGFSILDEDGRKVDSGFRQNIQLDSRPLPHGTGAVIASVPSGYTYLSSMRYGNITTWAVLVATLVAIGVSAGKAGSVASAIFGAIGTNNPVYLELTVYYNKNSKLYYQVIRAYRNSNYTGQIYYSEYGPYSSTSPLSNEEVS